MLSHSLLTGDSRSAAASLLPKFPVLLLDRYRLMKIGYSHGEGWGKGKAGTREYNEGECVVALSRRNLQCKCFFCSSK